MTPDLVELFVRVLSAFCLGFCVGYIYAYMKKQSKLLTDEQLGRRLRRLPSEHYIKNTGHGWYVGEDTDDDYEIRSKFCDDPLEAINEIERYQDIQRNLKKVYERELRGERPF